VTAPVALADHGDNCARCARPLNINEPLYCWTGGKAICAAFHDATSVERSATASNARAFAVDVHGMRTSELMKYAAVDLRAMALPGSLRDRAEIIARELETRADKLLAVRGLEEHGRLPSTTEPYGILRAIGEVRS